MSNEALPSRREAIRRTAIGFAIPTLIHAQRASRQAAKSGSSLLFYAGTYSSPHGPEGSKGNGEGIYLLELDARTGAMKQRDLCADDANPSWLAFHPSKRFLFAANEVNDFGPGHTGAVTSYAVDRFSGHLTKINRISSGGAGPAHLSVHPGGKHVFVANYAGGTFAVVPVGDDGRLAEPSDIRKETGKVGSLHAASAPPGSFAISGHDRPHAHMIQPDPAGKFVIGADLGTDQLVIWKFDAAKGALVPNSPRQVALSDGDGPRHFVFHPNGRWFYSLQEEASTLVFYEYASATGALSKKQQISTLPGGFAGTNFTSEVRISPDGRFLYAGNRLHDSISFFAIGPNGTLTLAGETWTRGDYPRSFTIDPSGAFLICCNQRGDALTSFRVNGATGNLVFTGYYRPLGTPAVILFL